MTLWNRPPTDPTPILNYGRPMARPRKKQSFLETVGVHFALGSLLGLFVLVEMSTGSRRRS